MIRIFGNCFCFSLEIRIAHKKAARIASCKIRECLNTIKLEQLENLEIGMTKDDVRKIMGSPMLSDPFHEQRWDYIYRYVPDKGFIIINNAETAPHVQEPDMDIHLPEFPC